MANCQLPTANCQLPTANYQLPISNCRAPFAGRLWQLLPGSRPLAVGDWQLAVWKLALWQLAVWKLAPWQLEVNYGRSLVTHMKDCTSMKSFAPSGASASSRLLLRSSVRSYASHLIVVE